MFLKKRFTKPNGKKVVHHHTRKLVKSVLIFAFLALFLLIYLTFIICGFNGLVAILNGGIQDPRMLIAAALAISIGAIITISHHRHTRFH